MNTVRYRLEVPTPLTRYVLEWVGLISGVRFVPATGADDTDLYYGNEPEVSAKISIPRREQDIVWTELTAASADGPGYREDGRLDFDLISGIGSFLTDAVNVDAAPSAFDEHDRLTYDGSFQARAGLDDAPIVNRYVTFLSGLIERTLGIAPTPLWPDGKRCAIALSHDVDAPLRHGASGGPLITAGASLRRNLLTNLYRTKWRVDRMFGATGLEHWHFPVIMDAESVRGFRSTFLFAVTRRFDKDGHPDFDVSYDVAAARFGRLFDQLQTRDFEIGLHAGYNACGNHGQFEEEKERLERLIDRPVRGLRHHIWHVGRDVESALLAHESAGFEFDSSIAFNRRAVFRRSVALPYRPWSAQHSRPIDVFQIPVGLMDGHIFYHNPTEEDAVTQVRKLVDTVRDSGGAASIDWHVRTSSPESRQFGSWGHAYMALLDHLAHHDDVWVTTLGEINDWIRRREKLMR